MACRCLSHIEKECQYCHIKYGVCRYRAEISKFCSPYCRGKYNHEHGVYTGTISHRLKRNCLTCGKEFEFAQGRAKTAHYCSTKCSNGRPRIIKEKVKRQLVRVLGKVPMICQKCGKTFQIHRYRLPTAKFCSFSCIHKGDRPRLGKKCTPEQIERIRMGVKKLNRGSEYYRKMGLRGAKKLYLRQPTSIEIILYETLKNRGLLFETQKIINGKFCVDAYIPSLNLIVEADGKYWHSLPKIVGKDKAENAYLTKCGYNLLRLTESEIMNHDFTRMEAELN
jgi:very-short-patch-repair endonuclease